MSARGIAALAAAVAPPLLSARRATAAPTAAPQTVWSCPARPPLPYTLHANSATVRSKVISKPTAVWVFYESQKFMLRKTAKGGGWVHITDNNMGKTGWASGRCVYRDVRMCLD
ncbi:SH3 domain-containing protein [Streptomyces sp. NPDC090493]|uniref:SH3 domain-containing protein n=1 Tax=Streptomyces sp. NPDC090493 TaxID=3365964 RepID=UPI0037F32B58